MRPIKTKKQPRATLRAITLLAVAGVSVVQLNACSSSSRPPSTSSRGQSGRRATPSRALTPDELFRALGCSNTFKAYAADSPGGTVYPCTGSSQALVAWSTAEINRANDYTTPDPGPAPKFSDLVVFTSKGARDVYEARDEAAAEQRASETDPVLRRVDSLEADLPDVVGPNWIEWGNDDPVAAAATNALSTGSVAPASTNTAQPGSGSLSSSVGSATTSAAQGPVTLSCALTYDNTGNATYTITATPADYTGHAVVTFYMKSRGITFPDQPRVPVVPGGPSANRHPIPSDDSGASAAPDTCDAVAS